jgi:hypothetical protein
VRFDSDELDEPQAAGDNFEVTIVLITTSIDVGGPGVNPTPPLDALALYD